MLSGTARQTATGSEQSAIGNRRSEIRWWSAALLVAVVLLTYWPAFLEPPGRDQGVFAYVGWGMLRGHAPYRDSWDLKPPGVYLTYAAAFLLGGRSMIAVRVLDLVFTLTTTVLVWRIGVQTLGRSQGLAAGVLYGLGSSLLYTFWARSQAETFLVLFLVLTYWLALKGKWLPAGAAAATVFWYKTTWILGVLPVALLVTRRSWKSVALGGALVSGAVLGYLAAAGVLKDMVETVFLFNRYYGGTHLNASLLLRIPRETGRFLWRSMLIGPLALVGLWRGSPRWMKWWFLGCLASVWLQGKLFVYHWIPALAPLTLLAGAGVSSVRTRGGRWATAGLIALFIAAGLPGRAWVDEFYPLFHHYRRSFQLAVGGLTRAEYLVHYGGRGPESPFSYLDDELLAATIRGSTGPDETVLIWGFEPLVNFLADRRSPSRFSFDYPLTFPVRSKDAHLLRQGNREQFLTELDSAPPRLAVLACGDRNPVEDLDSLAQMKAFPDLARFLHRRYRRVGRVGHFLLLERK